MREGTRLYRAILWVSEKGLADVTKFLEGYGNFIRGLLAKADPERLKYDLALTDQAGDLQELELLKATISLKQHAEENGGFDYSHGPALELAANALYETYGWEDASIQEWFAELVIGASGQNLGFDLEMEDEDESEA